jgi:hypothetical protein
MEFLFHERNQPREGIVVPLSPGLEQVRHLPRGGHDSDCTAARKSRSPPPPDGDCAAAPRGQWQI